jgi:4-hydroxybenzoate polyprenyltransferase
VATTASLHPEPFTARRFSSLSFVIEASRPGLWATAVWFYLLPLGRRHVVDTPGFWFGLVYVTLPLGLIIYGWNDIADATIDQLNPRKGSFLFGARGSQDQLARLPLKIALAQAIFAVLFMLFTGPKILIWFSGLIAFTAIYNFPRHGLKQNPPFDILNQAGYLLVFVLSSWLNHAPQLRWPAMLFGALFAMHSHVFGEVMDIVPDRAGGRRTTATVIGAVPSKLLISGMLAIEAILIYINHSDCWIIGALAFGAVWFVLDALLLWRDRPYSLRTMQAFMLGWNAIALGSMGWIWSNAVFIH